MHADKPLDQLVYHRVVGRCLPGGFLESKDKRIAGLVLVEKGSAGGATQDVLADLFGLGFGQLSPGEALDIAWLRAGKGGRHCSPQIGLR
jgi:hypothetical protein